MTTLEIRIIAYALLFLGIASGVAYVTHRIDANHYEAIIATNSAAQAQIDQTRADTAEKAAEAAKATQDAATARNREITDGLQSALAAATAGSNDLVRRLRVAQAGAAAPGGHLPQATGGPGSAGTAGVPGSAASVDGATADYFSACQRDAIRYQKLITEITPQL